MSAERRFLTGGYSCESTERITTGPNAIANLETRKVDKDIYNSSATGLFVEVHQMLPANSPTSIITNAANSVPTSFETNGCLQDGAEPACRERLLFEWVVSLDFTELASEDPRSHSKVLESPLQLVMESWAQ